MELQGSPDAKKPCKGILKTSSSFDKHSGGASHRKSAKFDELNVLQTYHPVDKDYGHMKIEEPKTPYNFIDPDSNSLDQLDAELLAEKLRVAANARTSSNDDSSEEEEDEEETEEQRVKRREFEKKRKAHYREFEAVQLARKLIQEEDDEDKEEDEDEPLIQLKRREFERKRKLHNREFKAVKLARKLIKMEDREQDELLIKRHELERKCTYDRKYKTVQSKRREPLSNNPINNDNDELELKTTMNTDNKEDVQNT